MVAFTKDVGFECIFELSQMKADVPLGRKL
jgi:hypothetical protein